MSVRDPRVLEERINEKWTDDHRRSVGFSGPFLRNGPHGNQAYIPLVAVLAELVASHRGLRLGRLFGRHVVYAGRRVCARLTENSLEVKLPAAAREAALRTGVARRAEPQSGRMGWTVLKASAGANALGPYLELAARNVAEGGAIVTNRFVVPSTRQGTPAKSESPAPTRGFSQEAR
jgi:hypothetical protein